MEGYILKEYYIKYLREICEVKESTIKHYLDAITYISRFLKERGKISNSIYEVDDLKEIIVIREYLYSDASFTALNERGHHMYSVGFNHYVNFVSGNGMANINEKIEILDMETPSNKAEKRISRYWKRSSIIKMQTIKASGYLCEIDEYHKSFISKSTGKQYIEGHHAIPMKWQENFKNSLDVYANIVCLCPICHRLIHYGIDSERTPILHKVYIERADRLAKCGIKVSKEEFLQFAEIE